MTHQLDENKFAKINIEKRIKDDNAYQQAKIEKAREFCSAVKELAKTYNLPFFVVTDGASASFNNGCEAVKNARNCHIIWEKENGYNPYEDWSKIKSNNKKSSYSDVNSHH